MKLKGILFDQTPFFYEDGYLYLPMEKLESDFLSGCLNDGKHYYIKLATSSSKGLNSSYGLCPYKMEYSLTGEKEIPDLFINPTIYLANPLFLSFLGLHLLTSSFKGSKRTIIVSNENTGQPKSIFGMELSPFLHPLSKDNSDLAIPKIAVNLNGSCSLATIKEKLMEIYDFLCLCFYRKDISLGEVYLSDGNTLFKMHIPSFSSLDSEGEKDDQSCIHFSYFKNLDKPIDLFIPSSKSKRLTIDRESAQKDMEVFLSFYNELSLSKKGDLQEKLSRCCEYLGKENIDLHLDHVSLSNWNEVVKAFRELRRLNLELALFKLGMAKRDIESSILRLLS